MKPFLDNKSYIGVNLCMSPPFLWAEPSPIMILSRGLLEIPCLESHLLTSLPVDFENNPTPRAIKLWSDVSKLIQDGNLKPVAPIMEFTMADVEKAFRFMQAGKHMGKVVVRVDENDVVPAVPRTPKVNVSPDATYVVAGLGGICREIGRWLAEKGAKSLVFLSRSAASGEGNKVFAEELRSAYGADIRSFDCDVGDRDALAAVLEQCRELPPVKGCVTGAMVLDVSNFDGNLIDQR